MVFFFLLLLVATGQGQHVGTLTYYSIEGHLPWLCLVQVCSWRESTSSTSQPALWSQIGLGPDSGHLVLDKLVRLEPMWAALSRAETVMQPSPAVLAAFCWTSLRLYCRMLSVGEKCLRLDLAATQRACIEDLLKYAYFLEA